MAKEKHDARTVDEYLALVPNETRAALEKLRKTIKSVVPDATEGISYQIAVIKHKGRPLVGIGASGDGCSFYLMSTSVIPAYKTQLEKYDKTKGTIHFPAKKPLPAALVKTLVKSRMAENDTPKKK
jgi:uncharacterized protein YdhG (YjbR/CyaY superfamily)